VGPGSWGTTPQISACYLDFLRIKNEETAEVYQILLIKYKNIVAEHFSAISKKKFWEEVIAYFPSYDAGHIENDASNNSSIVACVFVTAVRCLATIGGFLPSRCLATIGNTHAHTQERDLINLLYFLKIGK
jgi:hypothetical protein